MTESDLQEEDGLIVDSFIISNSSNPKRAKMQSINKAKVLNELLSNRKYREIVDFDDHFNEDVALDWTNPSFD